ncbi:hypothetical protein [Caballeronia insecticola]|uniref:Glycosyltransferase n=1 Tax=Caballeronia insecticola TaxID=758793 RepID=R4WGB6_9BURK|nr:hypothetical protein [Caballeronia insecticola]BAN22764.1 putative uncharacterized protein [Caballeronia insecticola]
MTSPFSIAIATPTRSGSFCMDYVGSVLELQRQCLGAGIDFRFLPLADVTLIDLARNTLANRFLWETSCTHLLFIDDDMGFHAGELARMFDYRDRDVIGALYPRRAYDWARIKQAVLDHPDIDPATLPEIAGDYRDMFTLPGDASTMKIGHEPVRMAGIPTGLMMISRACLMKLIEGERVAPINPGTEVNGQAIKFPIYEFFRQMTVNGRTQGEDYYFCSLVNASGGSVWGCSWIQVTHTGAHSFYGNLHKISDYL